MNTVPECWLVRALLPLSSRNCFLLFWAKRFYIIRVVIRNARPNVLLPTLVWGLWKNINFWQKFAPTNYLWKDLDGKQSLNLSVKGKAIKRKIKPLCYSFLWMICAITALLSLWQHSLISSIQSFIYSSVPVHSSVIRVLKQGDKLYYNENKTRVPTDQ